MVVWNGVLGCVLLAASALPAVEEWRFNEPDYEVLLPDASLRGTERNRQVNEHFHVLISPRSGDRLAFWTQESAEGSDDMHIAFARSKDRGRTWTAPRVFRGSPRNGSGIANAMWQVPLFSRSGRLYCFWNEREKPGCGMGVGYMKGAYSDDDGETWTEPVVVWQPRRWCVWQRPLRLAGGGRYLTAVSVSDEDGAKTCFLRFDNLDDDPEVADVRLSLFMDGERKLDGEEASIVKLPDGRLFAVMRSRFGVSLWTASSDGGETWSDAKAVVDAAGRPIRHPRAPCPLYDLMGDGAASGRYLALFTDSFDPSLNQWRGRGPLFRYDGTFDAKGPQPVRFAKGDLLLKRSGASHYGNSCYSSYTYADGEGVLWFPDLKFYLLGKKVFVPQTPRAGADDTMRAKWIAAAMCSGIARS